jgi:hypothetical protein
VFISPGAGPALSDHDETGQMLDLYRQVGLFPCGAHLDAAPGKIQAIAPRHWPATTAAAKPPTWTPACTPCAPTTSPA